MTELKGLVLLIGALAVGSALLTLVMTSFEGAGRWSRDVDQLVSDKEGLADRDLSVSGTMVEGSLSERAEPCEYRFDLTSGGATLPVRYAGCVVPDDLRDASKRALKVSADGKLDPAGHFEASQVWVSIGRKYEIRRAD